MIHDTVTIHVRMDAKTFRRFGFFDTLVLRRRWLSPAVFSAIFIVFSVICFCLTDKAQSALLGAVLLAVGLLLPACYFEVQQPEDIVWNTRTWGHIRFPDAKVRRIGD